MKKKILAVLAALTAVTLGLSACTSGATGGTGGTSNYAPSGDNLSASAPDTEGNATDAEDYRVEIEDDFTLTTDDGSMTSEQADGETVYTLTSAGEYNLQGKLTGRVVVNAPDQKVTLNLCGTSITSAQEAPLSVVDADKVEIGAKSDTFNEITDSRALRTSEDEGSAGAIYAKCDLELKGKGSLVVSASYNNGIHTTKDLSVKNLTLKVTAPNNALKGNDSVTIESGDLIAISTGGDGIKTEDSDVSSKGNQRGIVTISGGAVDIYAACDGIDASYNIVISGEPSIMVMTDKYSKYTGDVVKTSESTLYLRIASYSSSYRYAAYFYNDDGTGVWKNATYKEARSSGRTTYYYYELDRPSGYSNFALYRFASSQTENSLETYSATSGGATVNSSYDMLTMQINSTKIYDSWGVYSSSNNTNNFGGMQGGTSSGNSSKAEYSTKGMKADNRIEIAGGKIDITSYDDGIHANNDVTLENGETAEGDVYISDGEITLSSLDDAIHGDGSVVIDGGSINITSAYEGIEGNQIEFNGGTTYVKATDDGVNASGKAATPLIKVTGGYLDVTVGTGDVDGIDSNGNYVQTGGFVISRNATTASGGQASGLDTDGTCTITGGTFVCVGAIGETPSSASQSWIRFGSTSSMGGGGGMRPGGGNSSSYTFASGEYTVSGTDITFTLSTSYTAMWISSDQFKSGTSYTVTNGTTSYKATAK